MGYPWGEKFQTDNEDDIMNELQKKYEAEINMLVEACHHCAEMNFVTSAGGNLSQRVENDVILITPTKTPKRLVTQEDICIIDLDGNIIFAPEGKKPTGEWPFHTRIMRKRPDIMGIAHTHPQILTGFSIANNGLLEKPWLPEPIIEMGPILTVPYGTPLSEELSEKFDAVINDSNGFLMQNHGALFCSPVNVFEAVEVTDMAERMAMSVFVSVSMGCGAPITPHYVKEMDEVIRIRNLKMPGAAGRFASASDLYHVEE